MDWLIGRLRWIVVIAALGGPVLAYLGYSDLGKYSRLESEGAQTQAYILSAVEKRGRRGSRSYEVDLEYTNTRDQQRVAYGVNIDASYAHDIIQGDTLTVDYVDILYLVDDPDVEPVVAASLPKQRETATFMQWGGVAAFVIGLIGSILMFGVFRSKH